MNAVERAVEVIGNVWEVFTAGDGERGIRARSASDIAEALCGHDHRTGEPTMVPLCGHPGPFNTTVNRPFGLGRPTCKRCAQREAS